MVDTFEKKAAKSGHVNYIQEPIILKDNRNTVRRLIPHFIKRSGGDQLCLKIETETKQIDGVVDFNAPKSISLSAAETQVLVDALPKLLGLSELSDVRRHIKRHRFRPGPRETLLTLLVDIRRRLCGIATVVVRLSFP